MCRRETEKTVDLLTKMIHTRQKKLYHEQEGQITYRPNAVLEIFLLGLKKRTEIVHFCDQTVTAVTTVKNISVCSV